MEDKNVNLEPESNENTKSHSLTDVFVSVVYAMFGVQNHKRHQRDFEKGDPMQFIVIGILFVVAFVLILMWVVDLVLKN